jgi:hypothetical protein
MKGIETSGSLEASDQPADRSGAYIGSIDGDSPRRPQPSDKRPRIEFNKRNTGPGLSHPEKRVKPITPGFGGERQSTSSPTAEQMPSPWDEQLPERVFRPGLFNGPPESLLLELYGERGGMYIRAVAPGSSDGPHDSGLENRIRHTIAESVGETVKQFMSGVLEDAAIVGAHCIAPVLGHVVVLIFEGKELLGDAAALVSSDKPVDLHIPLLHLPPGVELEVGVELGGAEEEDGPGLIVFFAPGDGGVLHGVAMEREKNKKDEKNREKDEAAEKPKEPKAEEGTVIQADLSKVLEKSRDSRQVAAMLRQIGSQLEAKVWQMGEYRETPCITIYDERAELGVWLPRPQYAGGTRRLVLEEDPDTGLLIVRLVAGSSGPTTG